MGAEGPELEEPWALEGSIHDRETEARVGRDVPRLRPAEAAVRAEPGPELAPLGASVPSANCARLGLRRHPPSCGPLCWVTHSRQFLAFLATYELSVLLIVTNPRPKPRLRSPHK